MINNKNVLAIIPARGGSKGLPGKNIKPLDGKPLIAWTIELALQSSYIDDVVVSTDDIAIADISVKAGARIPFMRPTQLATDSALTVDVLLHCLERLPDHFDLLVVLQPTSPLRKLKTLDECISRCAQTNQPVISVTENPKALEWMFFRKGERLHNVTEKPVIPTRRQECTPVYYVDGNVYCIAVSDFKKTRRLFDNTTLSVISQQGESIDIDTMSDFEYCEYLIKRKHNNAN